MIFNGNAINFQFLLVEYYKKLNLDETDLVILLMIDHLTNDDSSFITADDIALKTTLSKDLIDERLSNLFLKKYIDIGNDGKKAFTSLEPIKKIVYKLFQETIFNEAEIDENNELEETRTQVFDEMQKLFQRSLTPLEINRIDDWIYSGTNRKIILDSIKDAKAKNITNINSIDRIIVKKMREEDNFGNEIKW